MKKTLLIVLLTSILLPILGLGNDAKAATITSDQVKDATVQTTETNSALSEYMSGCGKTTVYNSKDKSFTRAENCDWTSNLLLSVKKLFVSQDSKVVDQDGNDYTTVGGATVYIHNRGALASILNLDDQMKSNPPASGITFAQGEWNKIAYGYKAQAASSDSWVYYPGLGFTILNTVQQYWIVARNIAYIAMIFIMILVAFLVAFRSNFGGQTQVTIANSIPNIILALIMISISFPLSGLVIDFITIGTNAAQQILVQNTFSPGYESIWTQKSIDKISITPDSKGSFIKQLDNPKNNIQPDDSEMSVWNVFSTSNVNLVPADPNDRQAIASIIPTQGIVGDALENILKSTAAAGVANVLFQLVFIIAAFMASLKLFLKLLSKYLTLILYPIISPFFMLLVAIPGRGTKTITDYFRTLMSAALTFIAVYAVFLFIIVLGHDSKLSANLTYVPPMLGYAAVPTGSGLILGDYLKMLLGFGLFIATPAIPDVIDSSLNVINFNETRSGQVLRQTVMGSAARPGGGALSGSGVAGGVSGAKSLLGRAWGAGEQAVGGYKTSEQQKK